ncbi:hypothetical protein [Bacillus velezensis]|uniref:hypothetical protein n=1 Tax=Bacillus velezensis TaxID=492670 RepID=UPI0039AEF607
MNEFLNKQSDFTFSSLHNDPNKSFKYFFIDNKNFKNLYVAISNDSTGEILKNYSLLEREIKNYIIKNSDCIIKITKPIFFTNEYICTKFKGFNLEDILKYSNLSIHTKKMFIRESFKAFQFLLKKKIFWGDFAPRNICIYKQSGKFILNFIDFEKVCIYKKNTDSKFLLLWWRDILNIYGMNNEFNFLKQLFEVSDVKELDSFEKEWVCLDSNLTSVHKVSRTSKDIMNSILKIEREHIYGSLKIDGKILGKYTGEFLNNTSEVYLYKILLRLKKNLHPKNFLKVISLLNSTIITDTLLGKGFNNFTKMYCILIDMFLCKNLDEKLNEIPWQDVYNISDLNFFYKNNSDSFNLFQSFMERIELSTDSSIINTHTLDFLNKLTINSDKLIKRISAFFFELFNFKESDFNIFARGSYGLKVNTVQSDLDFEVYNNKKKNKISFALEKCLISILDTLGIKAEGSNARPQERDYVCVTESRDFEELFELREVLNKDSFLRLLKKDLLQSFDIKKDYDYSKLRKFSQNNNNTINLKTYSLMVRRLIRWYFLKNFVFDICFDTFIKKNEEIQDIFLFVFKIRNCAQYYFGKDDLLIQEILELSRFFKVDNKQFKSLFTHYFKKINKMYYEELNEGKERDML